MFELLGRGTLRFPGNVYDCPSLLQMNTGVVQELLHMMNFLVTVSKQTIDPVKNCSYSLNSLIKMSVMIFQLPHYFAEAD